MPYLYTAFYNYVQEGQPILKPLVYFDQEDVQTHYRSDEFIFGNQILVCPIQEPNVQGRRMYIPRGQWYNFWSDDLVNGGKEIWVDAPLDIVPIFIKAGAIIPKYPIQQYVDQVEIEQMTLDVYYKLGKENSEFYEDAHDGYEYRQNIYSLRTFKLTGKEDEVIIQQHKSGKFSASYDTFKLNLHGLPFEIRRVFYENEEVPLETLQYNAEEKSMIIKKDFSELQLVG